MLFARPQMRVRPIDPYQALAVVNELTQKLIAMPEVSQFALSMAARDACFHFGWTPEQMLNLDDHIRQQDLAQRLGAIGR